MKTLMAVKQSNNGRKLVVEITQGRKKVSRSFTGKAEVAFFKLMVSETFNNVANEK